MPAKALEHLAIIMDGNRRWAKAKGMFPTEGHRHGYETLKNISRAAIDRGIKVLTVFAFSTENWSRTKEEVSFLFSLLENGLKKDLSVFNEMDVRLRFIGRLDDLPAGLQSIMAEAEKDTAPNTRGTLQLAINYGGQPEIVDAIKKIITSGAAAKDITPELVAANMYSPDIPPPDLIIRTSGEQRLSGFLLWESAYSELMFVDKYWPDFGEHDLDAALEGFQARQRRFGK